MPAHPIGGFNDAVAVLNLQIKRAIDLKSDGGIGVPFVETVVAFLACRRELVAALRYGNDDCLAIRYVCHALSIEVNPHSKCTSTP